MQDKNKFSDRVSVDQRFLVAPETARLLLTTAFPWSFMSVNKNSPEGISFWWEDREISIAPWLLAALLLKVIK